MKISVITFWQSLDNYGQVLQGYAMQKVLKMHGHRPEIIRYGFHNYLLPSIRYSKLYNKKEILNLLYHIRLYLYNIKNGTDRRRFRQFKRKYIKYSSSTYNSLKELQNNPPVADCYVAGSDQIWAQLLTNRNNRCFFLDFGNERTNRFSYAASFAMKEYPQELKDELRELLKRFNAVSVREPNGIKICEDIGIEANLTLDPTLLLPGNHYRSLMKKPKNIPDRYCFTYHVNVYKPQVLHWNTIKEYCNCHNLSSIAVYANHEKNQNMEFLYGAQYLYPKIEEWLYIIYHAKFVVTSSFHGVVFCILLHKQFLYCPLEESIFSANDRVSSLLERIGLAQRITYSINQDNLDKFINQEINWHKIEKELTILRNYSMHYLLTSINTI